VKAATGGPAIARWLAGAGFTPLAVSAESVALDALQREPLAAAFVSATLGPLAVAGLVASAGGQHREVPVIVLGSTGTVQEAVDAMQQGAADYLAPPLDAASLLTRLRTVLERTGARERAHPAAAPSFTGIVGSSRAIQRVLTTLDKISRYKTNVLVLGESGTGKEIIARALHARGPRRQHLFVPLNCATLGRELLENELFGHEKGSFTGATERKKGLFELADGGTLFLDEIAEMDPSTQAKLLRVLERSEFRRVGGTGKVKVDLSVIAATNRNIEEAIRSGKFREDLYYRLKVVTVRVPPLRERKEDIPALIEAFVADFNRRHGGRIRGLTPQALARVLEYDWPGNVRELKHAVESAAILASGETIRAEDLPELARARAPRGGPARVVAADGVLSIPVGASLAQAERALIAATLERHPNRREAARVLGLGLRTLYTKLRQYGLREPGVGAETA